MDVVTFVRGNFLAEFLIKMINSYYTPPDLERGDGVGEGSSNLVKRYAHAQSAGHPSLYGRCRQSQEDAEH